MEHFKRALGIVLSITLIMCATLPSLALGNEEKDSTVESKLVEQLKTDLGEEKTEEILKESNIRIEENNNEKVATSSDVVEVEEAEDATTELEEEPEENLKEEQKDNIESKLISKKTASVSETKRFGDTATPWMYWYVTGGNTLHLTPDSSSGGIGISVDSYGYVDYVGLTKSDITTIIFDDDINAESCHQMFYNFSNLITITGISHLKTDNVECMKEMFYSCSKLTSLDVTGFDTSNVRTMRSMFYDCGKIPTLDLSSFDTSNVDDAGGAYEMFANCSDLSSITFSDDFKLSNADNMGSMFMNDSSLTSLDLRSFETSNVTNMSFMFQGCRALSTLTIDDSFDTSAVTDMSHMFANCAALTNYSFLSSFNTSAVINMANMFVDCIATDLDLSSFNTSSVTDMSYMFDGCDRLHNLNLSNFNTSAVTDMLGMFYGCRELKYLDLSSFNTANVTNMQEMFRNCSDLEIIYVSTNFVTTSLVTDTNMFLDCTSLVGGNYTSYNSSYVGSTYARIDEEGGAMGYFARAASPWMWWYLDGSTIHFASAEPAGGGTAIKSGTATRVHYDGLDPTLDIYEVVFDNEINAVTCSGLFKDFDRLNTITNINNLKTNNTTSMKKMFENCNSLTTLDVTGFSTSNVTSMSQMFDGCSGITTLDLSNFNTSVVTDMRSMFNGCTNLATIYASTNFVTTSVTTDANMFLDCTSLEGGNHTAYSTSHVNKEYARIDVDGTPGYFTAPPTPPVPPVPRELSSIAINTSSTVKTTYTAGEKFNPAGLIITCTYNVAPITETVAYNDTTKNSFTFTPDLNTALVTTNTSVTIAYNGKTTPLTITVNSSGGGTPLPPSGGGGNPSGGNGGGGGRISAAINIPITQIATNKYIKAIINNEIKWMYDPITSKWKLEYTNASGNTVAANNGFYIVDSTTVIEVNNVPTKKEIEDTYYFDADGYMVIGYIQTPDNKKYLFDYNKTSEEGKMILGWRLVQGDWYYFLPDGSLLVNGTTPDGYAVGADGKWVK